MLRHQRRGRMRRQLQVAVRSCRVMRRPRRTGEMAQEKAKKNQFPCPKHVHTPSAVSCSLPALSGSAHTCSSTAAPCSGSSYQKSTRRAEAQQLLGLHHPSAQGTTQICPPRRMPHANLHIPPRPAWTLYACGPQRVMHRLTLPPRHACRALEHHGSSPRGHIPPSGHVFTVPACTQQHPLARDDAAHRAAIRAQHQRRATEALAVRRAHTQGGSPSQRRPALLSAPPQVRGPARSKSSEYGVAPGPLSGRRSTPGRKKLYKGDGDGQVSKRAGRAHACATTQWPRKQRTPPPRRGPPPIAPPPKKMERKPPPLPLDAHGPWRCRTLPHEKTAPGLPSRQAETVLNEKRAARAPSSKGSGRALPLLIAAITSSC